MSSEPARIVGILTAILVAVIQTLVGQGVLTSDVGTTLVNVVTIFLPMIAAEVIRHYVTPVGKAANPPTT